MTLLVGVILVLVGTAHLNDQSAGNIRLGWGALIAGVVLCVASLVAERRSC